MRRRPKWDGPMLDVEGLSVRFGGIKAVDGVSFGVDKGEIFTIIGPNGAGKSTIFNLISRIYQPTDGTIYFKGRNITRLGAHRVAGVGIARTFQNIELFDQASVLDNMLLGRHPHRSSGILTHLLFPPTVTREEKRHRRKVEEVIDLLDLQHYRSELIANLPYGIRKVVEIGRALCLEPDLVLLDEPSSGLNIEETEDMSFWIKDIRNLLGVTVLMVEHDMGLVQAVSDRVMALNYGRVLTTGTADEVLAHPDVIRAYLGGEADGPQEAGEAADAG